MLLEDLTALSGVGGLNLFGCSSPVLEPHATSMRAWPVTGASGDAFDSVMPRRLPSFQERPRGGPLLVNGAGRRSI